MKNLTNINFLKSSVLALFFIVSMNASANNDEMLNSLRSTVQQAKIFPDSVVSESDFFGNSVAIDGNRALVASVKLSKIGKVYVYEYDGSDWIETAIIEPSGTRTADGFGKSVSLNGDQALIGAAYDSENGTEAGAAYLFELETGNWVQKNKIFPSDSSADQNFGWSVSLTTNALIVGTNYRFSIPEQGTAYFFRFNTINQSWYQSSRLIANDGFVNNGFGSAVSISASQLIVGAAFDGENGVNSGAVYVYKYGASTFDFEEKLIASDGSASDFFGISVSIDEDRLLVGARNDDNNGFNNSGSAYVFDSDGTDWTQSAKLTASDESSSDYFGYSVDLYGNVILVGATGAASSTQSSPGAAYVFELINSSWPQTDKITATNNSGQDNFGGSVALGTNSLIIGNINDDDNGSNAGAAYIFNDSGTWQQQQKLLSSFGPHFERFGHAVSIDGTRAVVGSFYNDDKAKNAGSAFIFDYIGNAWVLTQQIYADDAKESDVFGKTVDIIGDRVVIAATGDDTLGNSTGAVYIFDLIGGTWTQTTKITLNGSNDFDRFGTSLSLNIDRLLVGVPGVDFSGTDIGAAYIYDFQNNSWDLTQELTANDFANYDNFGRSVSLSGNRVVIGSTFDDDDGSASGSAYIFEFTNNIWSQSTKLTASDAASGDFFGGQVSLSNNTVLISAHGKNDKTGAAYIFDYDNVDDSWSETAKLLANDANIGDYFGYSVALDNNILLIGANQNNDNGAKSGSTYVFQKINNIWQQTDNLIANDGMEEDRFGQIVSLSSELALIGSPFSSGHGTKSGAAYVFDLDILPIAIDDSATLNEDTNIDIDVIANDTDPDGGNNEVISASDPINGTVSINSPEITYIPNTDYCNDGLTTDDFTYTLNGGAMATVRVTVTCVDEIATAVDDVFSIDEDVITVLTVLDNDYDVDSDNNTIMIDTVNQPTNGTVVNNNINISYTPNPEYCNDGISTDDFTYKLVGGWQATVAVTVMCIDDPGVANDDIDSVNEDGSVLVDVLANDTDVDGGVALNVTSIMQPQFGTVIYDGDKLRYTPNQDYCNDGVNIDDFGYTIAGFSAATVAVTVNCVNDQPDFSHLGDISTDMIKTYTIDNWAYDFDFGSASENSSQLVNDFNVMIVSDTNSVISFIDVTNDGQLSFTTTGNIGSAIIEVSLQDNGGTDNNGVDTSMTKSLTVIFDDTIYSNGFESSNESSMFDYIEKLAAISDDLVVPYYDQEINSIVFNQYEFTLGDDFFSQKTVNALQLWISEILRYNLPRGDFDLDGILNGLDESISL